MMHAHQYVNFVARAEALAKKHGPRFAPPKILRDLAARSGVLR